MGEERERKKNKKQPSKKKRYYKFDFIGIIMLLLHQCKRHFSNITAHLSYTYLLLFKTAWIKFCECSSDRCPTSWWGLSLLVFLFYIDIRRQLTCLPRQGSPCLTQYSTPLEGSKTKAESDKNTRKVCKLWHMSLCAPRAFWVLPDFDVHRLDVYWRP